MCIRYPADAFFVLNKKIAEALLGDFSKFRIN